MSEAPVPRRNTWWQPVVAPLAHTTPTPFYVASLEQLRANLQRAERALEGLSRPARVAYSVKTNYLSAFVREAMAADCLIEIVSHHELDYVLSLAVPGEQVVANGPAKSRQFLLAALDAGARVNLDSLDEARWVAEDRPGVPVGIRVAATLADGSISRFGVDPTDPEAVGQLVDLQQQGLKIAGLHTHHSSRRDADSYAQRVRLLADIARRLGVDDVRWLDIGGGFSSDIPDVVRARLSYPVSTWEQTGAAIVNAVEECFPRAQPEIIIEPGIGVLADTMVYVTSVALLKGRPGRRLGVVDGTMFEVNPLRSAIPAPAEVFRASAARSEGETVTFYGSTCMEIDTLGEVVCPEGVQAGDLLVASNIGAYGLCLAPDFILPKAAVVSTSGELLRPRQSRGKLGDIA